MFSRTERLLLRPGWREDAPALAHALSDEAVARHLFDVPTHVDVQDAETLLTNAEASLAPYLLVFVRTGGAPRLVGGCGIARCAGEGHDINFWIARPFWGLGFATEAAGAALRIARTMERSRITARPATDNRAAAHVLDKIGFRATGHMERRRSPARGNWVTCALFEDSGTNPARKDPALDLYIDRSPIAA